MASYRFIYLKWGVLVFVKQDYYTTVERSKDFMSVQSHHLFQNNKEVIIFIAPPVQFSISTLMTSPVQPQPLGLHDGANSYVGVSVVVMLCCWSSLALPVLESARWIGGKAGSIGMFPYNYCMTNGFGVNVHKCEFC